jgi:geranylgeranyl diphosphate synthase type II
VRNCSLQAHNFVALNYRRIFVLAFCSFCEREDILSSTAQTSEAFILLTAEARERVERSLELLVPLEPKSLYDPVRAILSAGGKRVRPMLTYFAAAAASHGKPSAMDHWVHAGVAVELLHTFTLVHDDIMDNASSRRGKPTVHVEYGSSAAILSGDVLIALAIESLGRGRYTCLPDMITEFSLGFKLVCEGQALDKDFELMSDISTDDYLHMIDLKTAKILELSAVLGAYAAGGEHVETLRNFAHHTGIAFQINDDLLDLTAEHAAFGKTIGGDILEGKRTWLYVRAMEQFTEAAPEDQALLQKIGDRKATERDIPLALNLFERMGVLSAATNAIAAATLRAQSAIEVLPDSEARDGLHLFSEYLLERSA